MNGKTKRSDIEWYLKRGLNLCLLDSSAGLPVKLRGKKPLRKRWNTRKESAATLFNHAASGGNLGFVLTDKHLVIDVDPRNGGYEGLKVLERDLGGVDLCEVYPAVDTGGGGKHFYCSKAASDDVRKKSVRYPGLDFLTGQTADGNGAHCVIPGGYHYGTGQYYTWDEISAIEELRFPPAPEILLRNIRKITVPGEKATSAARSPNLSNEELAALLRQIDVEQFRGNHDGWLSLMFACHQATGGEGRKAFIDWCVKDADYASDEGMILYRWESILDEDENLVTYRTLLNAVRSGGGTVPDDIQRKCDMADFDIREFSSVDGFDDVVEAFEDDLDDLGPADDEERAKQEAKHDEIKKHTASTKYEAIMVLVASLTPDTVTMKKIESIAKLCVGFDSIAVHRVKDSIKTHTKLTAKVIHKAFEDIRKSEIKRDAFLNVPDDMLKHLEVFSTDMVPVAVAQILKDKYRHGHTICRGHDGQVYAYNGTIWEPFDIETLNGEMMSALGRVVPEERDVAKSIPKCRTVLTSTIRKIDFTSPPDSGFDIFNFENCEIWVDMKNGKRRKKSHSFGSHQMSSLPYDFDNDARCPIFDAALKSTLSCYPDAEDVERHLWELYGYTLSSYKNFAVFVALIGTGGNGKSRILDALQFVLGDRALPGSLSDFGSGRSTHALTQLFGKSAFIDDDLSYNQKLPNNVIKKISESKMMTANPKYRAEFQFQSNVVCWVASNSWPYTGDTSNGVRRRMHIFRLTNEFVNGENADVNLREKIRLEAPGIFNRMAEGLIRFRRRGYFLIPESLGKTSRQWEERTNPVAAHLASSSMIDTTSVNRLYDSYREFTFESGRGDKISLSRYWEMVEALGGKLGANGEVAIPERFLK